MVNGSSDKLVVLDTKNNQIKNYKALPDKKHALGSLIDYADGKWLITDVNADDEVYQSGELKQCNHLFRFQNHTSDILECWGVLEKFQASLDEGDEVTTLSSKRNAILPYNDNTKKIFINKRLFIETRFDKNGNEIPVVYQVTNINSATSNYGNGQLLELTLEESAASNDDNITERIADYISPVTPPSPPTPDPMLLTCVISGTSLIKSGGSTRTWTATFYQADGTTIDDTIIPVWELVVPTGHESYFITEQNGNLISISAANESSIIGDNLKLVLTDSGGLYNPAEFYIEVVSAFG